MVKRLIIAGSRGIPASHGGFETFAERLAIHLTRRGWRVSVFCQSDQQSTAGCFDWNGIERIVIPVSEQGAFGTILFDWKSTIIASRRGHPVLTLGYNTAIFTTIYRLKSIPNIINMDGIEWRRAKWKWWHKTWLYINEQIGGLVSGCMVADHPKIKLHLSHGLLKYKRIEMIPYGADSVNAASDAPLSALSVEPFKYAILIARPEPENQILEIVRAFSARYRGIKLLVLGDYTSNNNYYQRSVLRSAGEEVLFPGAIYDRNILRSLRYYAMLYLHGHTVGGTNPALVEALGAGCATLAHDNIFNRWVAGTGAAYFTNVMDCDGKLSELIASPQLLHEMRTASRMRFVESFRWEDVLSQYEHLLESLALPRAAE